MQSRVLLPLAAVAALLLAVSCGPQPTEVPASTQKRVVGYYVDWGVYARGHHVKMIDASKVTHINYAFAVIGADFSIQLLDPNADVQQVYGDEPAGLDFHGNFAALAALKEQNPGLKTMISVGGWTKSGNFSTMAGSDDNRRVFVASVLTFIDHYRFDGVDLDWEYPVAGGLDTNKRSPDDKVNYTKLVKDLRVAFDAAQAKDGRHREISLAVTANPAAVANLEAAELGKYVDFADVMTYDFFVPPSPLSRHQAALKASPADPDVLAGKPEGKFNVQDAVAAYLAAGFPAAKLVLGVPFYGRGWVVPTGAPDGLYAASGKFLPTGTWEAGTFDYDDLVNNHKALEKGMTRWDPQAQASYFYDAAAGLFVSYDDEQAVTTKARWAMDNGLGGVMFWEFSADRKGALLGPIAKVVLGR